MQDSICIQTMKVSRFSGIRPQAGTETGRSKIVSLQDKATIKTRARQEQDKNETRAVQGQGKNKTRTRQKQYKNKARTRHEQDNTRLHKTTQHDTRS